MSTIVADLDAVFMYFAYQSRDQRDEHVDQALEVIHQKVRDLPSWLEAQLERGVAIDDLPGALREHIGA